MVSRIPSPEGEQANEEIIHARGTVSVQRRVLAAAVLAFVPSASPEPGRQ